MNCADSLVTKQNVSKYSIGPNILRTAGKLFQNVVVIRKSGFGLSLVDHSAQVGFRFAI